MIVAESVSIDGELLFLILVSAVAAFLVWVAVVWAITLAGVHVGRAASGRDLHPPRRGLIAAVTVAGSLSPLLWATVPSDAVGPIPPLLIAGLIAGGGGFAIGYLGGTAGSEPETTAGRPPPGSPPPGTPPPPSPPWASP